MSVTTEAAETMDTRNGHSRCLICGTRNPRSLGLAFEAGANGRVKTRFSAGPDLQGYDGFLHGGVIASLLDAAMTHCLFHHGIQAMTGDLHVRYLHPVPCTAVLDIHAEVVLSYPPLYRLEAKISSGGKDMARAEAKFMQRQEAS